MKRLEQSMGKKKANRENSEAQKKEMLERNAICTVVGYRCYIPHKGQMAFVFKLV